MTPTPTKEQIDALMQDAEQSTIAKMPFVVIYTIFFEKLKKSYPDFWCQIFQIASNAVRHKSRTKNEQHRYWHWVEFKEIPEFKQTKLLRHRPTRQDILMLAIYAKVDPDFQGDLTK